MEARMSFRLWGIGFRVRDLEISGFVVGVWV